MGACDFSQEEEFSAKLHNAFGAIFTEMGPFCCVFDLASRIIYEVNLRVLPHSSFISIELPIHQKENVTVSFYLLLIMKCHVPIHLQVSHLHE